MIAKKAFITAILLAGCAGLASAQNSYYDDDIYYDASKDKTAKAKNEAHKKAKEEQRQRELEEQRLAEQQYYEQLYRAYYGNYDPTLGGHDFESADTYTVTAGSSRNVDEYNRAGKYARRDTSAVAQQASDDNFAYTRRIEKYHNGDIISDVNDPAVVEYYYSQQPDINIYVTAPSWGYYSPWDWYYGYGYPYRWSYWDWYWGPSWSWSWGWGPSWSWSWGWGPSWSWSWGWGPSWGPSWGIASRPGSYTPNGRRPTGVRNGYTGLSSNPHNRPGVSGGSTDNRYNRGGNRYGLSSGQAGNYRPRGTTTTRPSTGVPSYNGHNSSTGQRNGSYGSTNMNRGRNGGSSSGTYRSGSTSRSSSGSFGGSSRGGSSSRNSGGGGGGSHRGGRR